MSDVGDNAKRLHEEAARMDPRANRAWPGGPIGDALWAIAVKLNQLNREQAWQGTSLLLMEPRDLAGMAERLGNAARIEGFVTTFESIGAVAVAGIVSGCRCEELDVSAGGDEAA